MGDVLQAVGICVGTVVVVECIEAWTMMLRNNRSWPEDPTVGDWLAAAAIRLVFSCVVAGFVVWAGVVCNPQIAGIAAGLATAKLIEVLLGPISVWQWEKSGHDDE